MCFRVWETSGKGVFSKEWVCAAENHPPRLASCAQGWVRRTPTVVVASLSIHYFSWAETQALVARIRSALRPGGVLLCRLNSDQDHHFGASGHPEIESNFFMVKGEPKRFFNEAAITSLFAEGWNTLSLEHFVTKKYVRSKALWEVILERTDA